MGNFTAIIPAAGLSSRMKLFKPLLPFGSSLVIEKTVNTFKQAGITDIRVVVGYKRNLLQRFLNGLSVKSIVNYNYMEGMHSSIIAGVATLDNATEAFFVLPGDCPFIQPGTIIEMQNVYVRNFTNIVYPTYHGQRGHPVLISSGLISKILTEDISKGLRSLLEQQEKFIEMPVDDPGVTYDMDSISDYLSFPGNNADPFPSEEECMALLKKTNVQEKVVAHSKEVSRIGIILAEYLNSTGLRINTGLVMAAGFLHDIMKGQHDHAHKGADILSGIGYKRIADIIAQHVDISNNALEEINEAAILYLADKIMKEDKPVLLEERLADSMSKHAHDGSAINNIKKRFNNAFLIKSRIEKIIGLKIEDILKD
ncbi:MAG: NTP transferase domain-containing protein [Spirochaetota bacterium]